MKQLKILTMMMALVGVFFLAACGNGMGDPSNSKDMKQNDMKKSVNMTDKSDMKKDNSMGSGESMKKGDGMKKNDSMGNGDSMKKKG